MEAITNKTRVGYIGLGDMGGALASRLAGQRPLTIYDLNPAAVSAVVEQGGLAAPDLTSLAASADVVLICLPTSEHVRRVVGGPGGLAELLPAGSLVIDQTTGDPRVTRELAELLSERGITLVDAPVSGGPAGALAGTIAIMVGAAGDNFRMVQPLLAEISPNVFHAGPLGSGHAMKVINNLVSCAQRLLSWEALTLAAKLGVDPQDALRILQAGGARNAYLEQQAPKILGGEPSAAFTLQLAHKDVRLAAELGSDAGMPTFFASLAKDLYQLCMNEVGPESGCDHSGRVFDRMAGTRVVPLTESPAGR
jgi:3-hydroxyisobutyrate dehydrogenase